MDLVHIFAFIVSFTVITCQGATLVIHKVPDYVGITDSKEAIKLSDIQNVLSEVYGFMMHKELGFHGIVSPSPFNHPKASLLVTLYGGEHTVAGLEGSHFPVTSDDVYVPTHHLEHNLKRFYGSRSNIFNLHLETKLNDLEGALEDLKDDKHSIYTAVTELLHTDLFNSSSPEVEQFLRQVALILQSADLIPEGEKSFGNLFNFELSIPEVDKEVVDKMRAIVSALLKKLMMRMEGQYGDDCLVVVVGLPQRQPLLSRKTRSLLADDSAVEAKDDPYNLATEYSSDYAAIFNIILWLVVFMALVVIYAMYGMMTMDPGSDSIIYRMTTTRLKKD